MSAPVLSPAEQDEVSRFGVHDEDVLRDMEEHLEDDPICAVLAPTCDLVATMILVCRACGKHICPVCPGHAYGAATSTRLVWHDACGYKAAMCDLVRVVPL